MEFSRNITDIVNGCPAAVSGSDSYAAIQAHADDLFNLYGGGELLVPPGNFLVSQTINLRGTTSIRGIHATSVLTAIGDVTVLRFSGTRQGCRDMFVIGATDWSAVSPAVIIESNRCIHMADTTIWHGATALLNYGNDGRFRDTFLWGHQSCMTTFGNNFYFGVKFDDCGVLGPNGQLWVTPYSVICGAGVTENYFSMCDFSGLFGYSFYSPGCYGHFVKFFGCIFSSAINVGQNQWPLFAGCTFGNSYFQAQQAALTVDHCYSLVGGLNPVVGSGLRRMGWDTHYNIV
jgi:hypothetical protein